MEVKSLILAAGMGTRMKSSTPKVLHKVNGRSMISRIVKTLEDVNVSENIFILGHCKKMIVEELGGNIEYVVQEPQLGTGHAISCGKEKLQGFNGDVLVLCGDVPLLTSKTLKDLINIHQKSNNDVTVLTVNIDNPFSYGRIVRNDAGIIQGIIEEKDASESERKIKEINTGIYCFKAPVLLEYIDEIDNNNKKNEYYLTDIIKILAGNNKSIGSSSLEDITEILGINSKVDLAKAGKIIRERKNKKLMEDGVILINPDTVYIEDDVEIGRDTIIYPNVFIEGNTKIGENVKIYEGTRIEDSIIEDEVEIKSSCIEESKIGKGSKIGPFAHLRPKSNIGEKCKVGNFVETKKSILHNGVKAGHLTYIGDAEIGENTNIGAGTITCNYDGKNKFKTNIGKDVFVGSDTKFIAPVNIGENSLIGAGSVITEDVEKDSLAIARAKQINKPGWVKKRK